MDLDPRTPVLVGAGQINDREFGSEPIDLMVRCTEAAIADSGAPGLRDHIGAVRVVWGVWPYADPGRLVAERIGRPGATTTRTTTGGNQVYDLVIDTAERIAAGHLDAVVICAAESMRTRRADAARGDRTAYLAERDGASPDEVLGSELPLSGAAEEAIGIHHPTRFYAMAETALRHRLGESVDDHRDRIARMWSRASAVAASNPRAWLRHEASAAEIATVSGQNRPIAAPYPKLMTSNLNVDQGGAVVMCSAATATAAGVPPDRWVFPWSGSGAADHWYPTERWALDESPAMRIVGRDTLALAGLTVDEVGLIDLYSCFPVAVQVAQREMGVAPDRDFTITGGLTFAAGPLNCYCILALTRAVDLVRETPAEQALLTGNGGYFTKHSAVVLSGRPSPTGFRSSHPQDEVDALPARPTARHPASTGTVEAYTVTYDRDMRPERAILAVLDDHGSRHWAATTDDAAIGELLTSDCCGRPAALDGTTATLT